MLKRYNANLNILGDGICVQIVCLHYAQADGVMSVLSRSGHAPMLYEPIAHWPLSSLLFNESLKM
jgi:hypothetical protein